VFSLLMYPDLLMDDPRYPQDVKDRVKEILSHKNGYSIGMFLKLHSEVCKQEEKGIIEKVSSLLFLSIVFIEQRYLSRIHTWYVFHCRCSQFNTWVLMYLCFVTTLFQIPYFLDEDNDWKINIEELEEVLQEAKPHCVPRLFILTNPGNPTGHVLTHKNIEDVIRFCHRNKLVLFADEVYQDNIYTDELPFYSCRKVLFDMGPEYKDVQLISLHCSSKGFYGEACSRGAYFELHGFDKDTKECFEKKLSLSACPNILGQVQFATDTYINFISTYWLVAMSLMCKRPEPGDESYDLFIKEKTVILESLQQKAVMTTEILNQLPGITCNKVTGSMYAFPKISLPPKAIEEAERLGMVPDYLYVSGLLEETGILVINGAGFGQREGTSHFRSFIFHSIISHPILFIPFYSIPVHLYSIPFYYIPFCYIPFYSISFIFHPILFYSIPFYSIPSHFPIPFYSIPF
ncbi:hypothetical protein QZH41_012396, partial [Actinostola sp. cb2023]